MPQQKVDRWHTESIQGGAEIRRQRLGCRNPVDGRAIAMAGQVDGDDPESALSEHGTDAPPGAPPARDPVDQDRDRRGGAGIGL